MSRRGLLRLAAGGSLAMTAFGSLPAGTASAATPIVKPLPPEIFDVYGTNAETRWGR
ncbi:hypothetical protein [Amycolatopsis sp. NPDC057786]|uniref:hypothetical protein n=1 Tax=Amycolatopsis sp. NPDC057786 TaxID=3346250 RepID=UPI0036733311